MGAALLLSGNMEVYADEANQPVLRSWSKIFHAHKRFEPLADFNHAAVLDRETGLVWERSPDTTPGTWEGGQHNCINKAVGGRKGWRLPSVVELTSLLDPSIPPPGPLLPLHHPFANVQIAVYWSATTFASNASNAWFVDFGDGHVEASDKTTSNVFWCVRGDMNTDTY